MHRRRLDYTRFSVTEYTDFRWEAVSYNLAPGVIRIKDLFDYTDYPFTMSDNVLHITFPEGYQLSFTKIGSSGGSEPPENVQQKNGSGGDEQIRNLLLSSAWCSFSFSGSSSGSVTSGRTGSSRVRFNQDGTYSQGERSEGYSEGWGGTVGSQHDSGTDGRWDVRNGMLYLSEGMGEFAPVTIQVKYNSNNYPIIVADDVEYSQCE